MSILKNKIMMILGALLFLGTSCSEDFLERKPSDSIVKEDAFKSYRTAQGAVVGTYNGLSAYSFDGLYMPIMNDLVGEDALLNSTGNYGWFVSVYQLNLLPLSSWVTESWNVGYGVIDNANNIIKYAPRIPDATEDQKNEMIAEAKAIRAYSYLQLVQFFCDTYSDDATNTKGLILATEPTENDIPHRERKSLEETYELILSDLKEAEILPDFTEDYGTGGMGKMAVYALTARAYLNMHNWEKASEYAKKVMDESGASLMTVREFDDPRNNFTTDNSETIFKIAYTREDNNIFLSLPSFYWPVAGYSSMRADDDFYAMHKPSDVRRNRLVMDEDIDPDNYFILKFGHNGQVGNAELCRIRLAEMVLTYAEAEARREGSEHKENAINAIGELMENRNAGQKPSIDITQEELIELILQERRKELFGEGHRMNDIKRTSGDLKRGSTHWAYLNIEHGSEDYYKLTFPIPQSEIDANDKLTEEDQNKGY